MKFKNVTNIIALILTLAGSLFKIEHWPGASILLILAFALITITIAISFAELLKAGSGGAADVIMHLSIFLFLLGGMFTLQHWPGGSVLLGAGMLSMAISVVLLIRTSKTLNSQLAISLFTLIICMLGLSGGWNIFLPK